MQKDQDIIKHMESKSRIQLLKQFSDTIQQKNKLNKDYAFAEISHLGENG